jgi:hypothetical protein
MSGGESSPPSIGFAVAKSLPHRSDISRYALRTVADTGATACTSEYTIGGARKLRGPPHRRAAADRSRCAPLDRVFYTTAVEQRRTSSEDFDP